MRLPPALFAFLVLGISAAHVGHAQQVLFEDSFDKDLSSNWGLVGLAKDDYRIRDGALEMRVQPGKLTRTTPMLKVELPFTTADTVSASVEVAIVDRLSEPAEFAGVFLTSDGDRVFGGKKMNLDGYLLFSPGDVEFVGKPGQEGDPSYYAVKHWPARPEAGPLRVMVRHHYAHFQVGPDQEGKFSTFFHSAIQEESKGNGFALVAAGGPSEGEHWVRFDNFKVVRTELFGKAAQTSATPRL